MVYWANIEKVVVVLVIVHQLKQIMIKCTNCGRLVFHLNQMLNKCTYHERLVFHLKSLLRITLQLLNEFFLPIDQPLNVDKHKTDSWNCEVPVLHVEHHPLGQRLRSAVDQQGVDFWKGQLG